MHDWNAQFSPFEFMIVLVDCILGDPGAVSRDDTIFTVKVYCKLEHCIVLTNCPWVSEDEKTVVVD